MMFLTVFLQFLAIATAIRVPTVWPEQQKSEQDLKVQQNAYLSDVARDNFKTVSSQRTKPDANQITNREFHTPKLEHQAADVGYVAHSAQHKRRPSGSHAEFVTDSKKSQGSKRKHNLREPDVSYSVHHPSNERAPTVLHAKVAIKNNNHHPHYNQNNNRNKGTTRNQYNNSSNFFFSQPLLYTGHNGNFFTSADGWAPITGQHFPHKIQETDHVYVHRNLDHKHNQIADKSTSRRQSPLNHKRQYTNANDRRDIQSASNYQPTLQRYSVLNKNYRDDKTHEPIKTEQIAEAESENEEDLENENEDLQEDAEKVPISEHETPREVPTRPNYPGEGLWAIRGLKHRPFPGHQKSAQVSVDDDEQPEGFETFQKAAPAFEKQHSKFAENLQSFPQQHKLGSYTDDRNEETKDEDHEELKEAEEEINEEDEEEDSFVPTRTLAQVRKTENEEYLPRDENNARLREVIKDSKIHTVYTEEGYEDIAYDHAGHEKKAEDSEGHAEYNKDAVKVKAPREKKSRSNEVNILKEFENYEDPTVNKNLDPEEPSDADVSASSYETPSPNKNMKRNKFAKTKENKTTKIKDLNDGDVEMEITSEVKIMTQPNNVSTAHKFVKIVPKTENTFTPNDNKSSEVNQSSLETLKRHKRFVNDFLKIDVNKDFLDALNVEKPRKSPVITTEKYPYYNIKDTTLLSKNSPLRYAEDLKNIPKKIPGRMSFYEHSKVSQCPEIPRNVNPIPDRVNQAQKKTEEGEENKESGGAVELPDVPRLRNLGDKIDCLKSKLFGDNPLDSPFFQETVVEPPESIFKDFEMINNIANNGNKEDLSQSKEILNEVAAISHSLTSQTGEYNDDYNEEKEQGEEEQEAEKFYSAADLNEEYEDKDADYQTVNHEIIVPSYETTTSTSILTNNYQTEKQLPESTLSENVPQIVDTPSVNVTSDNNLQTTEKSDVSVTMPEIKTLPPHYDDRINFIPKHIYDQIDYSQNVDSVDTTSHVPPTAETHTERNLPSINDTTHNKTVVISEAPVQDQIVQTTEKMVSSTAIPNRSTTPFTPKHIYDQIDYLDNSYPAANENNFNATSSGADAQKLIQPESQVSDMEEYTKLTNNRQSKAFTIVVAPNLGNKNETTASIISDSQSFTTKRMDTEETSPETAALRIQRRQRKRPKQPFPQVFDVTKFLPTPLPALVPKRPLFQVFDVTKYLPRPLPTLATYPTTSTVLPKYKTLSEVYYKDDIKPNEQLNVFADVINNIKNSPPEVLHAEGSENFPALEEIKIEPEHHQDTGKKLKIPPRKIRIKHNNPTNISPNLSNDFYITSTTTSTTTAVPRHRRKNKHKNHKPKDQVYEEYLTAVKADGRDHEISQSTSIVNFRQKNKPLTTNRPKDSHVSEDTSLHNPSISQDLTGTVVDDVFGLAPPFPVESPAVYPPLNYQNPLSVHPESITLNTFPVHGMKPPQNRKPLLYSDFRLVQQNRVRRKNNHHRIQKRSPFKPNYSEIKRDKPAQSSEEEEEEKKKQEEEDDYVPKRNRNFHYDVENDRVIYTNKKEDEEEIIPEPVEEENDAEEEEGVEYLTLKSPPPKFVVITTERNGPSFLEYVQQLRNDSSYRVIPEPTKKPKEEPTTKADSKVVESTTTKQVETVIPEFLNIVSKLKSNDDYREIKEKEKVRTTTASPEVEDEMEAEETEEPDLDVRNSPGAFQNSRGYDRAQIFDISEYLPQPRNYIPKTVIDYSKYKTIERAPVATRHNFSSRYNAEDDDHASHSQSTTETTAGGAVEDNIKASSFEQQIEDNTNDDGGTRRSGYGSSEETVEEEVVPRTTTEVPEITTTRSKRVRMRGRKRPTTTTARPTTSTTSPPSSTKRHRTRSRPTTTTEPPTEENFTHTQRTAHRVRSRPTTTAEPALEENFSQIQRVVRRRHPSERHSKQKVPHNHKEFYTPIAIEKEAEVDSKPPVTQRKRKVSRLITPDRTQLPTNTNSSHQGELEKPGEIQPRKLEDVQVFRKYDPTQKHGGNYRRADEDRNLQVGEDSNPQALELSAVPPTAYEIENNKEIRRLSDVVPKPFAFYSDPTLPKSVNQLKEPKATETLSSESEESEASSSSQEKANSNEDYDEEVKINFNKNSETVTKKPVYIVKDPSKRLYFYAPVK